MAKSTAAQQYLQARGALEGRLRELEQELGEIRAALGAGGASVAARKTGVRRGRRIGKRGAGLLAILRYLKDSAPAKPSAIARATGVKDGTVSNALNTLKKKRHASRTARGWSLTTAGKADLARRSGKS